ncbi:MAG: hypothetical protein QMD14_05890 [Candidatus Aenigmarchaeota archaeon]|nr:hypothetical protein [Candidatus Aenigmarchaeota archaeon]
MKWRKQKGPPQLPEGTKLPEAAKPAVPEIKKPLELEEGEGCEKCEAYARIQKDPKLKELYDGILCYEITKGIREDPNFFIKIMQNRGEELLGNGNNYFAYLDDIHPDIGKCLDRTLRYRDIDRKKPVKTYNEKEKQPKEEQLKVIYVAPGLAKIYGLDLEEGKKSEFEVEVIAKGGYGCYRGSGMLDKELTDGIELPENIAKAIFNLSEKLHKYTLRKVQKT